MGSGKGAAPTIEYTGAPGKRHADRASGPASGRGARYDERHTRRQVFVSTADTREWWRSAAIYQVYPRSFADGDGDGVGDLAGIRARLGYLSELGVDAIWFSPWFPSPMADAGYDVADYRDIDPAFGTLAEAEALIAEG